MFFSSFSALSLLVRGLRSPLKPSLLLLRSPISSARLEAKKPEKKTIPSARMRGSHALATREPGVVKACQIKAARLSILRSLSRKGKVLIRIFPSLPVTKKSVGVRMGKGKGPVSHWVSYVEAGQLLFEVDDIPEALAQQALSRAAFKFGLRTKIIKRDDSWVPDSVSLPGGRTKPKPMFWAKKHLREGKLDTRS